MASLIELSSKLDGLIEFRSPPWMGPVGGLEKRLGRTAEAPISIGSKVLHTTPAASQAAPGPRLTDILEHLKKRNAITTRVPRSQGGTGWFPDRGDLNHY